MLPLKIDGCVRQGHLTASHCNLSSASPKLLLNADFPVPCSTIWQALNHTTHRVSSIMQHNTPVLLHATFQLLHY